MRGSRLKLRILYGISGGGRRGASSCYCGSILTYVALSYLVLLTEGNVYSDDGSKFKCPLDPITDRYPDPTDPTCTHYFLCHLGKAFPQRCDPRRAFHPELKECHSRILIPEDLCQQPMDCDQNGYLPDPEDCTKYFMCFYRQAIPYRCTSGFYFDRKKKFCVKDKKKAKQCTKPKPERQPDAKDGLFKRVRYPDGGDGGGGDKERAINIPSESNSRRESKASPGMSNNSTSPVVEEESVEGT